MALLTDGKDVIDKNYKDLTTEMYAKGHSFFTYLSDNPDSLASCCRLRNQINENVFSFTNGLTGVQTGSCNVITINLSRMVQDYCKNITWDRKETSIEFWNGLQNYLTQIVERVHKYHIAYKTMLYE
jgi:ribonucleoside-triphosphate reductase